MVFHETDHCSYVAAAAKVLRDSDLALLQDDRFGQSSLTSPFSAWCPQRSRKHVTGKQDGHERPRAQQAIASKLRRLYPPSTFLAFDWRPMIERKTYRYVSDNGCYRRFKMQPLPLGASGADGSVEAKVRKYLRRLANGGDSGPDSQGAGERSRRQTVAVPDKVVGQSPEAKELPAADEAVAASSAMPCSALPFASGDRSAALFEEGERFVVGEPAEALIYTDSETEQRIRSSSSTTSGDMTKPSEAAKRQMRLEVATPQMPLQLPVLVTGGARYSGIGPASDDQGHALDIDQKLAMLNAELARDLALYDGGASVDDLWASTFQRIFSETVADKSRKSVAAGDERRERILGMRNRATGVAAERRIRGDGGARFAKLKYITREGDVVYVPVYRCVAVREPTRADALSKRDSAGHLSLSAQAGVERAFVDGPEALAGVKYRLTRRVTASTLTEPISTVACKGTLDDRTHFIVYGKQSRRDASLMSSHSLAPR